MPYEQSDEQLVQIYLSGDREAFDALVQRYLKRVYNFAYRFTGNRQEAEDLTQETFLRAWKRIKTFDTRRSFKTWLMTITKNACIDTLRKKRTVPFSDLERRGELLLAVLADPRELIDAKLERKSVLAPLADAVQQLSQAYREVLTLRFRDELTFREIAKELGEPLHTVKSRNRRALAALRRLLGSTDLV